jgi:ferredoxin
MTEVEKLKAVLLEIMEGIEARAREHQCHGIHCGTCNPMEWVELARKALGD